MGDKSGLTVASLASGDAVVAVEDVVASVLVVNRTAGCAEVAALIPERRENKFVVLWSRWGVYERVVS